ncbi:D-inositol-3-phosphate glycosyltransferase [Sulfuracidifex tepidarius]|uniref:D-inositol-3-phosphate glycosyltransferase n=1 Tax=Sulfuracidifex tepidarius TaxID=1294262 RepID=A0A510DSS7_9CREN|nr:glycosyltransferase family 4 protein [Sulfuracidifex tepidarius]BBG23187.1 D-inositol-3-phosphate glycosyltransferase [Sulfuracidifex tepidarius]
MKILISPPMRFGEELTGAARRTLEVYSRIGEEVYLCVDRHTLTKVDPTISPLLKKFKLVESSSTSRKDYIQGLLRCLSVARKVDVVLSYSEFSLSMSYSYLLSLLSGKPLLIFVHHVTEELRGDSRLYFLIKLAFMRSKGIICLDNPEVFDETKRMFPKKRILMSTNGIDVKEYYTSDEKICDGLFIGNYGERKGVDYLSKIWDLVSEKERDARLCIIGKGWKEIPRNAVYYGFVSEERKKEILAKSKVFIFPSLYEGFSLVTAEALASYLPVVTWDLPWAKRFLTVKISPYDVEKFSNAIIDLLKGEEKRRKLGEEGRKFAETLTWNVASDMEKKALYEILYH